MVDFLKQNMIQLPRTARGGDTIESQDHLNVADPARAKTSWAGFSFVCCMSEEEKTGRRICVGQFAGAHGVRGLVKLRSFTAEPEAIFTYAPLTYKEGEREFRIEKKTDMAQSRLRGTSKASVPQSSRASI